MTKEKTKNKNKSKKVLTVVNENNCIPKQIHCRHNFIDISGIVFKKTRNQFQLFLYYYYYFPLIFILKDQN